MNSDISSLPLPPHVRFKLRSAGFTSAECFSEVGPLELSKESSITNDEALEVLKLLFPEKYDGNIVSEEPVSALDLYQTEQELGTIMTFCEKLDDALNGGFPVMKLSEVCGAPGVGKTQLCLQLSVDVRIPVELGGVGGECVFIDTEGSFTIKRLCEIASATVERCNEIFQQQDISDDNGSMEAFTLQNILSSIHLYRCLDYVELISTVNLLGDILREHPKVKLILIDSIAFPFRNNFSNMALRTRLLNNISQSLYQIASDFKLAVVLTNQMTSRLDDKQTMMLVPALGESWGHVCTNRIILSWTNNRRYANLCKSPTHQETTVPFVITTSGIRDYFDEVEDVNREKPRSKRQKLDL